MRNTSAGLRSLTIVIPALNEEQKIGVTVEELLLHARAELDACQLILVNDGSCDRTGAEMERLAGLNPEIEVIHHDVARGVGASYKEGLKEARMNYITMIPGDHEADQKTWPGFFREIGKADLVIGYRANQRDARPAYRVVLSRVYSRVLGFLFNARLRDLHSLVAYRTEDLRSHAFDFIGYTYQLEAVVTMLRYGKTFTEVPVYLLPADMRSSRSLSFKTLRDVVRTTVRLLLHRD